MQVIKQLTDNQLVLATLIVMCCLGYISWGWFWLAFVTSEISSFMCIKEDEGKE